MFEKWQRENDNMEFCVGVAESVTFKKAEKTQNKTSETKS